MPLSEKARIEVYLPDLPSAAYQELLDALEGEFTYRGNFKNRPMRKSAFVVECKVAKPKTTPKGQLP